MSRPISSLFLLLFLAAAAVTGFGQSARLDPEQRKALKTIKVSDAKEVLAYLAGEECEGRGTGSAGYQKAAEYVRDKFKSFGLKPVPGAEDYFQGVPFTRRQAVAEECYLEYEGLKLQCGDGITFWPNNKTVEKPIVFVRAGKEGKLRDEDAKVLRGAIVILNTDAGYISSIMGSVRRQRPAAIINVVDQVGAPQWNTRRPRREVWGGIDRETTKKLAKACGVNSTMADDRIPEKFAKAQGSKENASLVVALKEEKVGVPNVVAMVEGTDPQLKDEWVICGSHLDHLGVREDGKIRYGADDDGSGSTALVVLAKAIAENPPKRSVMFLAFCGEELGLVGSKYYCDHPLVPHEKVVCELQMDMIGRNEEKRAGRRGRAPEKPEDNINTLHLIGSKRISMDLHKKVLECNRHIGFEFEYDEESVYTRSDHYNFAKVGIPIAFFFSGFHPDYHQISDTPDKINYEKLVKVARLVYLTVHKVGNQTERIALDGTDK